jgi:sulfite reductase alpha subunit-like flavoprotein
VQHLIQNEKALLKNAIVQRGGYFYVSGSSKDMPTAVREALEEAIGDKSYVEQMLRTDRYQEETWA